MEVWREWITRPEATAPILVRIISTHFCAGVEIGEDGVTRAAPILAYMTGWSFKKVFRYADRKGWHVQWWRVGRLTARGGAGPAR